jgi:hypothetical protein|tara:strand:- start:752 stop:1177 length:426 start_codon:yes stop_codon:yes gene_type:complete
MDFLDYNRVLPKDLELVWPSAEVLLGKSLKHSQGQLSMDNILEMIKDKTLDLFIGYDKEGIKVSFTTQVIVYPTYKAMRIIHLGTKDGMDYDAMEVIIDMIGDSYGCKKIELYGRKGWEKTLKEYNYYYAGTILMKNLKEI